MKVSFIIFITIAVVIYLASFIEKKIKRKEIALIVGTSEATISRELKNNSTPSGKYIRTKAHDMAMRGNLSLKFR